MRTVIGIALVALLGSSAERAMAQTEGTATDTPLQGPRWKVIELAGKPVPSQEPKREAHLVFQPGARLAGSDGCNRITGSYEIKGDALTFGQIAGTMMACIDAAADVERAFREALKNTARWTIKGDRLELMDAKGARVAVLSAPLLPPPGWKAHRGSS